MDNQQRLEGDLVNHNTTSPVDKFTLFPKLPTELRLKIWSFALPGPRVITITSDYSSAPEFVDRDRPESIRYKARACPKRAPALLHCNSESRTVALKSYKLLFSKNLQQKPIYMNSKTDSLCMVNGDALRSFGGVGGANFHPPCQMIGETISKEPRDGVVIIRGKLLSPGNIIALFPLRVLRHLGFNTILLELMTNQIQNVGLQRRANYLFNMLWSQVFGKESHRPKLVFHSSAEIAQLVEGIDG